MMFNGDVGFRVATFATPEELVADYERCGTWTGCTGFRIGNVLFLNDSTGEDGAQEYASILVQSEDEHSYQGIQFDTYTFSWMKHDRLIEAVTECAALTVDTLSIDHWKKPIIVQKHEDGVCLLCQ